MSSRESQEALERRALELLPWYVNGTLEGEERELVRRQVQSSLGCRRELERLRGLQERIRRDDPETVASERAYERLMARIEAGEAKPQASTQRYAWRGTGLRFAAAASVIAAFSLAWWWAGSPAVAPVSYETMSSPQSAGAQSATVRVKFVPGVDESQQRELLANLGLRIIGAPATDGVLTLAFAEDADPSAILAALRQDPRILLVTTPPAADAP